MHHYHSFITHFDFKFVSLMFNLRMITHFITRHYSFLCLYVIVHDVYIRIEETQSKRQCGKRYATAPKTALR